MQMDNVYQALRPYMQSDPRGSTAPRPYPDWSSNIDGEAKPAKVSHGLQEKHVRCKKMAVPLKEKEVLCSGPSNRAGVGDKATLM